MLDRPKTLEFYQKHSGTGEFFNALPNAGDVRVSNRILVAVTAEPDLKSIEEKVRRQEAVDYTQYIARERECLREFADIVKRETGEFNYCLYIEDFWSTFFGVPSEKEAGSSLPNDVFLDVPQEKRTLPKLVVTTGYLLYGDSAVIALPVEKRLDEITAKWNIPLKKLHSIY